MASSIEVRAVIICESIGVAMLETLLAFDGSGDDLAVSLSFSDVDVDDLAEGLLVWAANLDDVAAGTSVAMVDE